VTLVTYFRGVRGHTRSMNTFSPQTLVGEIAAQMPLSVRVFERLGIDFCCGGKMPRGVACEAQALDPATVLEEIQQVARQAQGTAPAADWTAARLGALIDHILTTHHVYMKSQLPRLEAMLEKILHKHGARHGDVLLPLAETFRPMKAELDGHLMKEEMVLFPLIRSLEGGIGPQNRSFHCGSVQNPIRVMVMEHDSAGEALARLRELTAGYTPPEDACNTFRAFYAELADMERDLHQHIHLENNILFPRAVKLEAQHV
jgi:regulator of cell morphogenesis and NO signaling